MANLQRWTWVVNHVLDPDSHEEVNALVRSGALADLRAELLITARWFLHVHIIEARDLRSTQYIGSQNPYCNVVLLNQETDKRFGIK